jgi:diguanylate cyclase (GGDEF)-like protein
LEAELFIRTEKCENAIEMLQSLNLRFPKNREYLVLLATAYYSARKYHRTIHICSTLMKAGFNDPKIKKLFEVAKKNEKAEALEKMRESKPFKWCLAIAFPWFLEGELQANSTDKTLRENLVQETLVDDRTGLYNDRAARHQIPALAARRKNQFLLAMGDIDFFKSFNDVHYNHQVGNAVLKALAKAGQKIFTKDHIWRYGGEEIIWVHDGSEQEAVEKAEEFRRYVEEHVSADANEIIRSEEIKHYADGWDHKKDELFVIRYPVTLSQAVVLWGEDGNSLENLLTAADDGLYNAKEAGRNAIVYRNILRNKGEKPIKYTPELLEVLHEYSVKKGTPNWWAYLPTISPKVREEVLEYARNTLKNKEVMLPQK